MALKHLALLRHGHAESHQDDHARPLSERGAQQAASVAGPLRAWLERAVPGEGDTTVLVSSARRARETWDALGLRGIVLPARVDDALYLASPGEIFATLQSLPDATGCALVIGHNPGLGDLVRILAARAAPDAGDAARGGLGTAHAALLSAEIADWDAIAPDCATLTGWLTPDASG